MKKLLNKKNIYRFSFILIFVLAFAGYYIYQDKRNEELNVKKINEERIEKNKRDEIEILSNAIRLDEAKKKARDNVTSYFENAIKDLEKPETIVIKFIHNHH